MKGQIYTKDQVEKLGNALIYFIQDTHNISKTKLLKLIYLVEEVSVRNYGMPFFGIDFELWSLGPVVKDLYIDLSNSTPELFKEYISTVNRDGATFVTANKDFCDEEFSEIELQTLQFVADTFKKTSAEDLVTITHREGHPWMMSAQKSGYLALFEAKKATSSNEVIDMSVLLNNDEAKKDFYLNNLEYLNSRKDFKGC